MKHTIAEIIDKVNVLHNKAITLYNSQYRLTEAEQKYLLDDIRALARDICCDDDKH